MKDKMKGMLWGLLVGDAFGSPIQFSEKDGHPWITEMEPTQWRQQFAIPPIAGQVLKPPLIW